MIVDIFRSIVGLACLLAALPLDAAEWCMLDDSELRFETTFEGSTLPGRFRDFDVSMTFDPVAPAEATLRVSVALSSADMGDPDINAAIAEPDWFDVAAFPSATYVSDEIVNHGTDSYLARGRLALKGTSRVVDVPFTWSESGDNAEMRGELVLKRSDFGVGSGEWASGETIGIDVRLGFIVRLEHAE